MTPSNPTNGQPLIYRIMDALGVSHLVACINHTHEQSEVEGLPAALNNKAEKNHSHDFIGEDTDESAAEVIANEDRVHIEVREVSEGGGECDITPSNIGNLARALETPDTTPTTGSDKLVTSGGVKAALDGKQGTLTFDSTPTAGSTNPVTSSGLASALSRKASVSSVNYDEFTKSDDEEKIDLALVMSDSTQKNYILKNISNNNFNVSDFFEDANIYFTNDAAVNRDHFAFVKIIKEDNGSMILYYVITEGIIGL